MLDHLIKLVVIVAVIWGVKHVYVDSKSVVQDKRETQQFQTDRQAEIQRQEAIQSKMFADIKEAERRTQELELAKIKAKQPIIIYPSATDTKSSVYRYQNR